MGIRLSIFFYNSRNGLRDFFYDDDDDGDDDDGFKLLVRAFLRFLALPQTWPPRCPIKDTTKTGETRRSSRDKRREQETLIMMNSGGWNYRQAPISL